MNIILLIIAICYPFIFKYIEQYFSQKGKNAAQKKDVRDIQYESKKGENIATKETILTTFVIFLPMVFSHS